MAEQPIKKQDIIEDNIFTALIKEADVVIEKEKELIEVNKKLLLSYKEIANAGVGNDSKALLTQAENAKKAEASIKNLTDSELYLIEVETAKKKLQQEEIKLTNALEREQKKLAKALADASGEYKKGVADLRNLKNQLKDLEFTGKTNTKVYKDLKKEFNDLDAKVRKAERSVGEFNRNVGNYPKVLDSIGGKLAGAFSVGAVVSFGKKIIDTRAEFQKFEAVLTNSLGSSSAAQKSLEQIQKIAAKTPFSVRELTESYVKLVNRGFKPSTVEITKLGDLAASQGKQFDQLTEALLDAQSGEFERLKEFGIRAKTTGDTVALSFKGQTVEVNKFNETALRNAIIGFGELEGVAGGMAAISDTLGGKISNLGDNFDAFFNNLGKNSEGVFAFFLDQFNEFLSLANESQTALIKINDELKKGGGKQTFIDKTFGGSAALLAVQKGLDDIANSTLSTAQKTDQYQKSLEIIEEQYKRGVISETNYLNATILVGQAIKGEKEATDAANASKKDSNKLTDEQIKKAKELAKAEADLQNQLIKLRIDNTELNQRREEDLARNENRLAKQQLEASKGTQETKNRIIVELDEKLRQDLIIIRDKYAKEEADRLAKEADEKLKKQQEEDKKFLDAAEKQAQNLQAIADKNKEDDAARDKARKERNAKELKDATDLSTKILDVIAKESQRKSDLRTEEFERQISDTEKNIEHQRRLAENGKANTLAFEEEQKRKTELLKEQEKEREIKRQKAIAFFKVFSELIGQGKQPAAALGEAAATTYAADAIAGSFIKGTENVERDLKGSKVHNGTDGYVIAVDGKERILNPEQNNKVGALSNEELADLAYRHNNGLLDASLVKMSAYPQNDFAKNVQDSALLMQTMKLNENITDLKDIIKSRPVPSFKVDSLGNVIENIYQNGTTKIIKHINSKKRI